eukprot:gene4269-biopygen12495
MLEQTHSIMAQSASVSPSMPTSPAPPAVSQQRHPPVSNSMFIACASHWCALHCGHIVTALCYIGMDSTITVSK